MSAVLAPIYTGTLSGKPLRFFKAPLPGPHFPWHVPDELHRCMGLPRELRRHFRQRLQSSEWKDDVRTVATAEGIATIAPHFIAQGMIGAMQEAGRTDHAFEIAYTKQLMEAWKLAYPGERVGNAFELLIAAFHNNGARP